MGAFGSLQVATTQPSLSCMREVSLQEVVRTVHMRLDLAKLQRRVVDILITDLAKFFDVMSRMSTPSWEPVWAVADAQNKPLRKTTTGEGESGG